MSESQIGERLRRYRREAGLTLQQVADAAGVTAGFLSQAERNLTGISISSLANLAKALDVPLRALLDQPAQERPATHQGRRRRYATRGREQIYERLSTAFPGHVINAVKLALPPGYRSERVVHDGEEFVYVLIGKVRYSVAGIDHDLGPGDSLHFDARQPHRLATRGAQPAELISIGTMDVFGDDETWPKKRARKKATARR